MCIYQMVVRTKRRQRKNITFKSRQSPRNSKGISRKTKGIISRKTKRHQKSKKSKKKNKKRGGGQPRMDSGKKHGQCDISEVMDRHSPLGQVDGGSVVCSTH